MKKLMYTGVIALGLGLMSFTNNSVEKVEEEKQVDCLRYAQAAMIYEQQHYGYAYGWAEYLGGLGGYLQDCNSANGYIEAPIFID